MRILVLGPSGSGKSTLANRAYPYGHMTVDLDMFGVRIIDDTKPTGWRWYIPPTLVQSFMDKNNIIAFGIMDNWREIVRLDWHRVVILVGDAESLAVRGVKRDKQQRRGKFGKTKEQYVEMATAWNLMFNDFFQLLGQRVTMVRWDADVNDVRHSIISALEPRFKKRDVTTFHAVDEILPFLQKQAGRATAQGRK